MTHPVRLDALHKRFGSTVALNGLSWAAPRRGITVVLGPNGAGKSTAVDCAVGLATPDEGTVRVLEQDPASANAEHRARVGVMLQSGGLPNGTTPTRLLRHLAAFYTDPVDVPDLSRRLGVHEFARTTVRRLSGGQKQRLALAAALVGRPEVLFLDEPAAGLDPHGRLEVWDLIREQRDAGVTVVLTTHSFEEASRLADHVVIMSRGQTRAEGSLDEVAGQTGLEQRYFDLTRDAGGSLGGEPR